MMADNEHNKKLIDLLLFATNREILTGTSLSSLVNPEKWSEAFEKTLENIVNRPQTSYMELKTFRKYVPFLLYACKMFLDKGYEACAFADRMLSNEASRNYERWSPEEDEILIEWVCRENASMTEISLSLGRTVPAIKVRLSYLVGVKRLSQKVAGKFIGTIDGEEREAVVEGTVHRT